MPSFDVVSRVDLQEVDNAINQAVKEIEQRFDFRGSRTEISRDDEAIQIRSSDEFKVKAATEVLHAKLARRGVPLKALAPEPIEAGSSGAARQRIVVQQGIQTERARELVKLVKQSKIKVQAAIQGDEVRISGKKRDDLQTVISQLKAADFPAPLQFINFRD